jgi:hypothetical protein
VGGGTERDVLLRLEADEMEGAASGDQPRGFAQQPRLADAWLAEDQRRPRTGPNGLTGEHCAKHRQLVATPDELRDSGQHASPPTLPTAIDTPSVYGTTAPGVRCSQGFVSLGGNGTSQPTLLR